MLGNLQQELDLHGLEREDDPNAIATMGIENGALNWSKQHPRLSVK